MPPGRLSLFTTAAEAGLAAPNFSSDAIKITTPNPSAQSQSRGKNLTEKPITVPERGEGSAHKGQDY
jgi:hypothetical protein